MRRRRRRSGQATSHIALRNQPFDGAFGCELLCSLLVGEAGFRAIVIQAISFRRKEFDAASLMGKAVDNGYTTDAACNSTG